MHSPDFDGYIDRFGLLVQKDGDAGDQAQRVGTYYALQGMMMRVNSKDFKTFSNNLAFKFEFLEDLDKLTVVKYSRFRRSADKEFWGYNPTNFSADQHSILNLAMAVMNARDALKQSTWAIFKRGGFHQNFLRGTDDETKYWKCPDFIRPSQVAVYIRGTDKCMGFLLLPILDLGFLLDLVLRRNNPHDYDNMMAQNLFYAVLKSPTLVSRLAFKLYCKTDFMNRIKDYHCEGNGIPPLYALYERCFNHIKSVSKIGV